MSSDRHVSQRTFLQLPVILAAGSLTTMAGSAVAPVLPDVVRQLAIDPALAGNLLSIHAIAIATCSPPLGILADKLGPLRILLPSLCLYALFGTAGAWMSSFWPLLTSRALMGAATAGVTAGSLSLLGQLYDDEGRARAIGYVTSVLTVAGILFPLLGGWVGSMHWRWAFYLYGVGLPLAALTAFAFTGVSLHQTKHPPKGVTAKLKELLRQPGTQQLLLCLALASIAMYAVVIYAPLYLRETFGIGTALNGVVLATRAVGAAAISAFGAKQIASACGRERTTTLGFGLMALTLSSIPSLEQLVWILLAAVGFGVGFGLVLPTLYSALANLAPAQLRGSLMAAGIGAGFLGQFLSPIVLGPIVGLGQLSWAFYGAAAVALLAGLLAIVPLPRSRQ